MKTQRLEHAVRTFLYSEEIKAGEKKKKKKHT